MCQSMESKRHKTRGKVAEIFTLLIYLAMGVCHGVYCIRHGILDQIGLLSYYVLLLVGIVAFLYIHIILHELGHLIGGRLTGYRFVSFRIGSFMWIRRNGKLSLAKYSLAGTGGQCLMDPPEWKKGKIPFLLYNAGGVLMNLLACLVFFAAAFLLGQIAWLHAFFILGGLLGIALMLVNGIPMQVGSADNDGNNIKHMRQSIQTVRCFWVQLRINAENAKNIRIKDMPEEWFLLPSDEAMQNGLCAAVGVAACSRAMDQMDFALAKKLADKMLRPEYGTLPVHRYQLTTELIFVELMGQNRRDVLQAYATREYQKFDKVMKSNPSRLRTQYAWKLLGDKNPKAAQILLDEFEKVAARYPYACEIEGERQLIAAVQAQYQASNEQVESASEGSFS